MSQSQPQGTITNLLHEWRNGNQQSFEKLLTLVYDILCGLARKELARERLRDAKGLDTGDLVHHAYFSLARKGMINWQDRAHFFNLASRSIRRVLIQEARRRATEKRGHGYFGFTLDEDVEGFRKLSLDELFLLDELLDQLFARDELSGQIVELRYFAGFNVDEIAEILSISTPTVKRKWRFARAWLFKKLTGKHLEDHPE